MALSEEQIFHLWQAENAYMKALANARITARNQILADFRALENWRDEDIKGWKQRAARIQEDTNIAAGRLTVAKQTATRRVWGVNPSNRLNTNALSVRALRPGLAPEDPWQSVANEFYYNLSTGEQIKNSLIKAENRIDAVSKSITQQAADAAASQNVSPRLTGYMRVLSGTTKHCNLCLLASTRVYRARTRRGAPNTLKPIHDRCTCIIREVFDYAVREEGNFEDILDLQQNLSPEERDWLLQNTLKGQDVLDSTVDNSENFDLEAWYREGGL